MTPYGALKAIDKVHDYPCPYGIGGTAWLFIRECIEKRIPKEPIITTNNRDVPKTHSYGRLLQYKCPTCEHLLFTRYETDTPEIGFYVDDDYNCCSKCGQTFVVKGLKRRKRG